MFKSFRGKIALSGVTVLMIGVALLIFTFLSAYGFLTESLNIIATEDLVRTFGEALAPLIGTCIRVMYLGIMGWIGSLVTIRGVTIIANAPKLEAPVPAPTPVPTPAPAAPQAKPVPAPAPQKAKAPPPKETKPVPKAPEPEIIVIPPDEMMVSQPPAESNSQPQQTQQQPPPQQPPQQNNNGNGSNESQQQPSS